MTEVPLAKAAAAQPASPEPHAGTGSPDPAVRLGHAPSSDRSCSPRGRRWRPPTDWKDLLSARSPEGILDRIVDGDPLGLRRLVGEVIRRERRIADPDRVHLRAIACIAHRVTSGDLPDSPRWLEERVRDALAGVLAAESRKQGAAPPGPTEAWSVLAGPLGLDSAGLRRACTALNQCASEERGAFFALVIDGLDLEEAARGAGVTAVEFAKRARRAASRALEAFGFTSDSAPDGRPVADAARSSKGLAPRSRAGDPASGQDSAMDSAIDAAIDAALDSGIDSGGGHP